MAVTVYSHQDAAGPGLNLTGNNLERLKQILIPCLVNGYAGKPAAGWNLIQNIAAGFSLERASGGVVNFTRPSTSIYGLHIYLAESLTSTAASPPSGQNLRSGPYSASSNPSDTNRHWIGFFDTYAVTGWLVLATPTAVLVHIRTTPDVNETQTSRVINLFLGSAKLHSGLTGVQNMLAIGGQTTTGTYTGTGVFNYVFDNGYTVLRDTLTGAVVTGAGLAITGTPAVLQQSATYSSPLSDALPATLRLNPLHISATGAGFHGFVPGVLYDQIIGHYIPGSLMTALGFTPTVEAWVAPKDLGGYKVWPIPTAWGLLFFTDDPGVW